jgi:major intracellular serine protease
MDLLLKCFCESRRIQAFYTKCLEENVSEEGRVFLMKLVEGSTETSKKIKEYCIKNKKNDVII